MNREPKISEIEKLLNHFRETNREDELFEILERHNIKGPDPLETIVPETHEISEEAFVLSKVAKKTAVLTSAHNHLKNLKSAFKHKWYLRYFVYYIFMFLGILAFLNFPLLAQMLKSPIEEKSQIITVQELERYAMAESAPLDPGEVVPAQSQLLIPKINVVAPIIFPPSNAEAVIQENLTKGVVHYNGTANPGEIGNSFITGHSSNFWWIKGNFNYIFVNLEKLTLGDQAKIYHNGNKYIYQVKEIKVVEANDVSVLDQTDTPVLTLMTYTPTGTNWRRLIVVFDQISPKYVKPKVVTKEIIQKPDRLVSTDTNSTGGVMLTISNWFNGILGVRD